MNTQPGLYTHGAQSLNPLASKRFADSMNDKLIIFEIFGGLFGSAFFGSLTSGLILKLIQDRAAGAAEEYVIKPAIEFVKTSEFWDDLDGLVDEIGLANATKCLLIKFGIGDGVTEAINYVAEKYSPEIHRQKIAGKATDFDLEDLPKNDLFDDEKLDIAVEALTSLKASPIAQKALRQIGPVYELSPMPPKQIAVKACGENFGELISAINGQLDFSYRRDNEAAFDGHSTDGTVSIFGRTNEGITPESFHQAVQEYLARHREKHAQNSNQKTDQG